MNLNKYDSQGFPYTAEEAAERAAALFMPHYLVKGYEADPLKRMGQRKPMPYNVGRNAAKRYEKAYRADFNRSMSK